MGVIHMETEIVKEGAECLLHFATDLSAIVDRLSYHGRILRGAWQGGRSENFVAQFNGLIRQMNAHIQELDQLGLRVIREVNEWEQVDRDNSFKTYWEDNWLHILKDATKIGVAASFAAMMRTSVLRPNSIIISAPPLLREIFGGRKLRAFIGLEETLNIIKPSTLAKKMFLMNLAVEVTPQLISDFREYGLSKRFVSAALVDAVLKSASSLLLFGASKLIMAASFSNPVTGGLILLTWVAGPVLWDYIEPGLSRWFESHVTTREALIEQGVRAIDKTLNFGQYVVQSARQKADQVFSGYIRALAPSTI
nr:hypothetical protein [Chloroflexota bacterium]